MDISHVSATAIAALLLSTSVSSAAPAVALIDDAMLVMFDTDDLSVTGKAEVEGVGRLVGIDLRPADQTLIGVNTDNAIFRIDPATGKATQMARMATPLPMGEMAVIVDFNPKADRLRYMAGTVNHRVNVDTGEVIVDGDLAFEAADMHAGEMPDIVAAAYSNSFGRPETTDLYDVDATIGALIRQVSPNEGTLAAIGKFGVETGDVYAFDIHTTADGTNTAYLVTRNVLHTVDMKTGKAEPVGAIVDGSATLASPVRDVTILPGS